MQNDHNVPCIMKYKTRHKKTSKRRLKVSLMHKKKGKKKKKVKKGIENNHKETQND